MTTWQRATALGCACLWLWAGCTDDGGAIRAAPDTNYEQAAENAGIDFPPDRSEQSDESYQEAAARAGVDFPPEQPAPSPDAAASSSGSVSRRGILRMEPIEIVGRVPSEDEVQQGVGGSGEAGATQSGETASSSSSDAEGIGGSGEAEARQPSMSSKNAADGGMGEIEPAPAP